MTLDQKKIKLKEVEYQLKQEFIGIDSIIDEIIQGISIWYLSPEIIDKPLIINVWGITGTGKSSVIEKLIKLLELPNITTNIDCGTISNDKYGDNTFSNLLDNKFKSNGGHDYSSSIFVLDEFQFFRTIDENGLEISKPEIQGIWSLLNNGIVKLTSDRFWYSKTMKKFVEDVRLLLKRYPNQKINNHNYEKSFLPIVSRYLGVYYSESSSSTLELIDDNIIIPNDDQRSRGEGILKITSVLPQSFSERFFITLNELKLGYGVEAKERLDKITDLLEYVEELENLLKELDEPLVFNFSKSLIFIIGNLDEAFPQSSSLDVDTDADVLNELTDSIGILQIKSGLQRRFRNEQVGRFGNIFIKYPSPKAYVFREIISRELKKLSEKFKKISGIELLWNNNFEKMVYSESVFPLQGIRPVFSSVSNIMSLIFSKILSEKKTEDKGAIVEIYQENFNCSEIEIHLFLGEEIIIPIELSLGKLRDVSKCEYLGLSSVHEAGHAVVYSHVFKKIPSALVGLSSSGGGYTMREIKKDLIEKIPTKEDINNEVMFCLAGWCAERLFFEEEKCSGTGASRDIQNAWNLITKSTFEGGYLTPHRYKETIPTDPDKAGIADNLNLDIIMNKRPAVGITGYTINLYNELLEETKELIKKEKELIRQIALYLVENRTMNKDTIINFIEKYGKTFDRNKKESIRDYYLNKLKNYKD